MHPSGVLLDLDGTLTDSAPGLLASLGAMHEALGWPVPSDDELRPWLGPPVSSTLRELGHDEDLVERGVAAFRRHLHDEGLAQQGAYDGIVELLAALEGAGIPTSIATFKLQEDAERVAGMLGLETTAVHGRIAGDDDRASKAALIRRALDELGLDAGEDVVMVGDRLHDVEGALEVGLTPVGVAYGYGGREELREAGAAHVVDSVAELRALLLG